MRKNILLSFLACNVLASPFAYAEESSASRIYKIRLFPIMDERLVTDISIEPEDLAYIRREHPGVPRESVTPCMGPSGNLLDIFRKGKYYRINELEEVRISPSFGPAAEKMAPNATMKTSGIHGIRKYYPLQVTTKSGEVFENSDFDFDSSAAPWRICTASGELKGHAFPFQHITMRLVNSSKVMHAKTTEIVYLKSVSNDEFAEIAMMQSQAFDLISGKGSIQDLSSFILLYTTKDAANLVSTAERQLQKANDEAAAPILAQRAQEQTNRARQIEATNAAFRSSIAVGTESNCGPVLEIKGDLIKVYSPVQNYGNEHWIRRNILLPRGYECRFVNGIYRGS